MRDLLSQIFGWGLVCLGLIYASATHAQSPGFDCAQAKQPIERLICAHPELSALDAEMAEDFKTALSVRTNDDRSLFLADQRQWLRTRVDVCDLLLLPQSETEERKAVECLRTLYQERVSAIPEWRPPQNAERLEALAVLARIQTALNHVAAGQYKSSVAIGDDPLGEVVNIYRAYLDGDDLRFRKAYAAVVKEVKLRIGMLSSESRIKAVSEKIEILLKQAPVGKQPTDLGMLVALRMVETILWEEKPDAYFFDRSAWLRMPCRTDVSRLDAIEQAAQKLLEVFSQEWRHFDKADAAPYRVIACPSKMYSKSAFREVGKFASDPGANALQIANSNKEPEQDVTVKQAMGARSLAEARLDFSKDPSLNHRQNLVMFLHAFMPISAQRDKEIRKHLREIIAALMDDLDISNLPIDQALFSVLDSAMYKSSLSIPCPVILRDSRYIDFLFPNGSASMTRAIDQCGEDEPKGFPDREIWAFYSASMLTHHDWINTTGTNGNRLISSLYAKVSALRFLETDTNIESPLFRPYETWSYLALGNRAIYLPFNDAYEAALTKLTAYYMRFNVSSNDAKALAQKGLFDATIGGECGGAAPRPSIRKLVVEQAPLETITHFLSSAAARDDTAAAPFRACAENVNHGAFDQMAHMAVYDPKVFAYLLEFASQFPTDEQTALDLEMGIDLRNDFGKTPLMTAAQFDFVDTARMLLSKGAQVNTTTNGLPLREGYRTPLMYAAQSGSLEMIKMLLAAGADPWQADGSGKIPLDYLVGTGPTVPNSRLSPEEMIEAGRLLY